MIFVIGISTVWMLAGSSDGAMWGVLGVIVGTACALLGLYAGHQSTNCASV